jgi:hypothetical protein
MRDGTTVVCQKNKSLEPNQKLQNPSFIFFNQVVIFFSRLSLKGISLKMMKLDGCFYGYFFKLFYLQQLGADGFVHYICSQCRHFSDFYPFSTEKLK